MMKNWVKDLTIQKSGFFTNIYNWVKVWRTFNFSKFKSMTSESYLSFLLVRKRSFRFFKVIKAWTKWQFHKISEFKLQMTFLQLKKRFYKDNNQYQFVVQSKYTTKKNQENRKEKENHENYSTQIHVQYFWFNESTNFLWPYITPRKNKDSKVKGKLQNISTLTHTNMNWKLNFSLIELCGQVSIHISSYSHNPQI